MTKYTSLTLTRGRAVKPASADYLFSNGLLDKISDYLAQARQPQHSETMSAEEVDEFLNAPAKRIRNPVLHSTVHPESFKLEPRIM